MSVRAIVVTVCLVTLLPGVAAAQSIGGGVKGGVSLADVRNISKRQASLHAAADRLGSRHARQQRHQADRHDDGPD